MDTNLHVKGAASVVDVSTLVGNLKVGGTASVVGESTLSTAKITGASTLAGTVKVGAGYTGNTGTGVTLTAGGAKNDDHKKRAKAYPIPQVRAEVNRIKYY